MLLENWTRMCSVWGFVLGGALEGLAGLSMLSDLVIGAMMTGLLAVFGVGLIEVPGIASGFD